MNKSENRVILTDVDGVLLDWTRHFHSWMTSHNYQIVDSNSYCMGQAYGLPRSAMNSLIRTFNESARIGSLPPLRDAMKYIKKLHEEYGFVFHVISSVSLDSYVQRLRTENLQKLYGNTAFEKFIYLDTGAPKTEILNQYKDTGYVWVEDKPENALEGVALGLDSIVMAHDFNHKDNCLQTCTDEEKDAYEFQTTRVNNWKDIYEYVTG